MPLGDSDFGVFFDPNDFSVPVSFGGQLAYGNLDAPGKDAIFSELPVSDTEYRLELAASAFAPFPASKSQILVNGASYVVRSVNPLDDGATVELKLRKV